ALRSPRARSPLPRRHAVPLVPLSSPPRQRSPGLRQARGQGRVNLVTGQAQAGRGAKPRGVPRRSMSVVDLEVRPGLAAHAGAEIRGGCQAGVEAEAAAQLPARMAAVAALIDQDPAIELQGAQKRL